MVTGLIIGTAIGFVVGILVGRKNKNTVEKVVGDVKEKIEKAK